MESLMRVPDSCRVGGRASFKLFAQNSKPSFINFSVLLPYVNKFSSGKWISFFLPPLPEKLQTLNTWDLLCNLAL